MLEREYLSFLPSRGETLQTQLIDCLHSLASARRGAYLGRILKATLFLEINGPLDWFKKQKQAAEIMRGFFKDDLPPFSIVGQAPEKGLKIALYAEALPSAGTTAILKYKSSGGIPYCSVEGEWHREVLGAGLTAGEGTAGIIDQSETAFRLMKKILKRESLVLGDVVRQWNYIENLLRVRRTPAGKSQNYQAFNDIRRRFYGRTRFPAGFPAATGIGMSSGVVVLEFLAISPSKDLHLVPISNPRQIDAHRYSQAVLVGDPEKKDRPKAPPLFERAKYVGHGRSGLIFISGTAAVRDEATAARTDVESQTWITMENIQTLISRANLRNHGIETRHDAWPLSYLRAYVKRREDLPVVRKICQKAFGDIPAHFVQADICRRDLLVEMEGVARLRPENGKGPLLCHDGPFPDRTKRARS